MTMTRSTSALSCLTTRSWKVSERASPKKVISGYLEISDGNDLMKTMTNLHYSCNGDVIGLVVSAIFISLSAFLLVWKSIVRRSFSLQACRFSLSKRADTSITTSYSAGLQIFVNFFTFDFIFAFQASCSGE